MLCASGGLETLSGEWQHVRAGRKLSGPPSNDNHACVLMEDYVTGNPFEVLGGEPNYNIEMCNNQFYYPNGFDLYGYKNESSLNDEWICLGFDNAISAPGALFTESYPKTCHVSEYNSKMNYDYKDMQLRGGDPKTAKGSY